MRGLARAGRGADSGGTRHWCLAVVEGQEQPTQVAFFDKSSGSERTGEVSFSLPYSPRKLLEPEAALAACSTLANLAQAPANDDEVLAGLVRSTAEQDVLFVLYYLEQLQDRSRIDEEGELTRGYVASWAGWEGAGSARLGARLGMRGAGEGSGDAWQLVEERLS